jgi:hypothetical protein
MNKYRPISRMSAVIDCSMMINNAMDYSGAQLNIRISLPCQADDSGSIFGT